MYRNSLTDNCVYKVYLTINELRLYLFMKTGIIMFLHIRRHFCIDFIYCWTWSRPNYAWNALRLTLTNQQSINL